MRAPRRFIPTESFGLSIGLGALIPFLMIFVASGFPEDLYIRTILLSPFVCGFSASVVFGAAGRRGIGHTFLIGLFAYLAHYSLLFLTVYYLGFGSARRELGIAMYLSVFPPFFFVAVSVSLLGAVFGWVAALALRR